jgi:hypothetical protein
MSDKKKGIIGKKRYQPPALMLLGEVNWGVGFGCSTGQLEQVLCGGGALDNYVRCGTGGSATGGDCGAGGGNTGAYDPIIP